MEREKTVSVEMSLPVLIYYVWKNNKSKAFRTSCNQYGECFKINKDLATFFAGDFDLTFAKDGVFKMTVPEIHGDVNHIISSYLRTSIKYKIKYDEPLNLPELLLAISDKTIEQGEYQGESETHCNVSSIQYLPDGELLFPCESYHNNFTRDTVFELKKDNKEQSNDKKQSNDDNTMNLTELIKHFWEDNDDIEEYQIFKDNNEQIIKINGNSIRFSKNNNNNAYVIKNSLLSQNKKEEENNNTYIDNVPEDAVLPIIVVTFYNRSNKLRVETYYDTTINTISSVINDLFSGRIYQVHTVDKNHELVCVWKDANINKGEFDL